jgi:hypothetical protein
MKKKSYKPPNLIASMNNKTTILSLTVVLSTLVLATTISMQPVLASQGGASQLTPGHLQGQGGASQLTPGHLQNRLPDGGCDAPLHSPGHLFKQPQPTT